ncbi:MAG: GNAT family N-acetyltransferase [Chloroflexi bacterium]|nr:GNAT family N-acetyltransferase [Chloroflexota bacterium]
MECTLRPAAPDDLTGIDALVRQASDVFGFVPRVVIARAIEEGKVLVLTAGDGRLIGAIRFHHRRDGVTTIHEVVVAADARKDGVGRTLVQAVHDAALARGQQSLRAKCPIDALANGFYRATGWERVAIEDGRVRELVVWRLPVRPPARPRTRPTFYLSLTGEAGGIRGVQERWDRDGAAVGRADPFGHITFTPTFMSQRAVDVIRGLHESRGSVVMADSGAYQVQMGRGRHSELLEKLVDLYPRLTWVDRFVLPDHVPHSSDSPSVVEEKVEESIKGAADLLRRLPEEFAPRMIGVVHGRTLEQIGRCVRAYHQMGVRSIAFGSFGTSGRMLSVNQVSAQSIRLLHGAQDMARVRGMSVHVLGIGSPRYLGALRAADVWPDSFDSAGWWKAGAFGNIFFPDSKQLLITMMEGITATPAGAAMLRDKSGHECTYCADIEPLRRDRMGRILHNLAAMIDMVKSI